MRSLRSVVLLLLLASPVTAQTVGTIRPLHPTIAPRLVSAPEANTTRPFVQIDFGAGPVEATETNPADNAPQLFAGLRGGMPFARVFRASLQGVYGATNQNTTKIALANLQYSPRVGGLYAELGGGYLWRESDLGTAGTLEWRGPVAKAEVGVHMREHATGLGGTAFAAFYQSLRNMGGTGSTTPSVNQYGTRVLMIGFGFELN